MFFSDVLTLFVTHGWLQDGGSVWLPNVPFVSKHTWKNVDAIKKCFDVHVVQNEEAMSNPLFAVVNDEKTAVKLSETLDGLKNSMEEFNLELSEDGPFIRLVCRKEQSIFCPFSQELVAEEAGCVNDGGE